MSTDLLHQLREHDLPPKWDGLVVRWTDWADEPPMFICPPPRERTVCARCGSVERRVYARGLVALSPMTTLERMANYERFGKLGKVARWRLGAWRCTDCRHDQVLDMYGDTWWDLDFTDYGPDGSA